MFSDAAQSNSCIITTTTYPSGVAFRTNNGSSSSIHLSAFVLLSLRHGCQDNSYPVCFSPPLLLPLASSVYGNPRSHRRVTKRKLPRWTKGDDGHRRWPESEAEARGDVRHAADLRHAPSRTCAAVRSDRWHQRRQ